MPQIAPSKTERIKNYALKLGAEFMGVVNVGFLKEIHTYIPNLFGSFPRAISSAVCVEKFGST